MRFTTIKDLLHNPARSRHREYLPTTQFIRDVVLAAGNAGYDLLVYLPTVDSDGFDVILDDRRRLLPLQLKSSVLRGKAAGWSMHKTLLWPDPEDAKLYGLNPNWPEHGRAGGVVLVRAGVEESDLVPRYFYTDIDVLAAMWYEVWPLPVSQRRRVDRVQAELSDDSDLKIVLPRSAFLPVSSAGHLLALSGLSAEIDLETDWRSSLRTALRSRTEAIPFGDLDPQWSSFARADLQKLVAKPATYGLGTKRSREQEILRDVKQDLYRMQRWAEVIDVNDEHGRKD